MNKLLVYETDWLASTPFFFNQNNRRTGFSFHDVIRPEDTLTFHPEGLFNYLDFGYSVFGQSPVDNVEFLRYSSRLWHEEDGSLSVEELSDPVETYRDFCLSESDLIDLIRERVQRWEASLPASQEIVLPLSGGYDSRFLLWCLRDPSRVRAYTYGISNIQHLSSEVVHAQALAQRFDLRWEQIALGDFHAFLNQWDSEFGLSTHAHGMYHYEFFSKIRQQLNGKHALLSGVIGDAWAGSIPKRELVNLDQLTLLGYTHSLRVDPQHLLLRTSHEIRETFWNKHLNMINDHKYQVIIAMRLKIILLSYLMRVPRLFDFEPWSPFLDVDIAMAMLNLPAERRSNRQWQRDFFVKEGLDLENQGLISSGQNTLDFQALDNRPLQPLNRNLLANVIDPVFVEWVNHESRITFQGNLLRRFGSVRFVGGALRRIGYAQPQTLAAYIAYMCLKPIENSLIHFQYV